MDPMSDHFEWQLPTHVLLRFGEFAESCQVAASEETQGVREKFKGVSWLGPGAPLSIKGFHHLRESKDTRVVAKRHHVLNRPVDTAPAMVFLSICTVAVKFVHFIFIL